MKKFKNVIILIVTLLISIFLFGCEKKLSFEVFTDSLNLKDNTNVTGYHQNISIRASSIVIYEEVRVLETIDSKYQLTTQVLKRLNDIESDTQFSENEEAVVVIVSEMDNGTGIKFLEEYFKEFNIDKLKGTLVGSIKADSVKGFMNDLNFSGKDVTISIILDPLNYSLKNIIINYITASNHNVSIITTIDY